MADAVADEVIGAVLCGGASTRMGRPKAMVEVDGTAMAARVADALRGGGASRVVLVGGDPSWAATLELDHVEDRWPGEGPLGGLATAVLDAPGAAACSGAIVVVGACDQPWLEASAVEALVAALVGRPDAGAAGPRTDDDRLHPFPSAWRARMGRRLGGLMASGARRADAGYGLVTLVDVDLDPRCLADVDVPSDLPPGGGTFPTDPPATGSYTLGT